MKEQKGVTLIIVIITVIFLLLIAGIAITSGVDTYKNSKVTRFETYMKMIQKKVDIAVEEKANYTTMGTELTSEQKSRLQSIITNNDFIETDSVEEKKLRYFSANDIATYFNIKDVNDEFIINFANREVISLNGVEKDGVICHVELELHSN